ncbi:MAG: hypothetical protein LBE82_12615 [Chitinophagaceae bacterium]|jgi:membrane protein YdbS with pleckstrin-like domain|nr:hypothetical protein [Chitinophagaceae bacterium]
MTEEEKFIAYWEANRDREKKLWRQIAIGVPVGFFMSIGILITVFSGWYTRAVKQVYSEFNPVIIIIAVIVVSVFIGIFYKKHQWDMNEERYQEFLARREKMDNILPR